MEEVAYLGERICRWQVGASLFLAWPERGARLMNWNIGYPDGTFRDIVRWPELQSPDQVAKARGGNPILFPFSGRSYHQGALEHWADAAGVVRPMPMHGFARQCDFKVTRIDKTGFAARLLPDELSRAAYPYRYEFEVIYRFQEKELNVELRLANLDTQPIPWSAGHHFYFTLPWADGMSRGDYTIRIPAKKAAYRAEDGSLEPVKSFKKADKVAHKPLVDRIHYQLANPLVECVCEADDSRLEIEVGTSEVPNPDYALVTWTESDEAPYFCIEPWMGPPNSPEHKVGLHQVLPGDTGKFSVTVRI